MYLHCKKPSQSHKHLLSPQSIYFLNYFISYCLLNLELPKHSDAKILQIFYFSNYNFSFKIESNYKLLNGFKLSLYELLIKPIKQKLIHTDLEYRFFSN